MTSSTPETSVRLPSEDAGRRDAHLLRFLDSVAAVCPVCGAELNRPADGRCGACGVRLRLGVRRAEPRLGAWLTLTVPLLLCASVGLLVSVISRPWVRVHPDLLEWPVLPTWIMLTAAVPLAGMALALRRRFLRLSTRTQWLLAGVTAGTGLVALLVFVIYVD